MDRYTRLGLRSDADEKIRRGLRDAFARAGLSHEQFLDGGRVQRSPAALPASPVAQTAAPAEAASSLTDRSLTRTT